MGCRNYYYTFKRGKNPSVLQVSFPFNNTSVSPCGGKESPSGTSSLEWLTDVVTGNPCNHRWHLPTYRPQGNSRFAVPLMCMHFQVRITQTNITVCLQLRRHMQLNAERNWCFLYPIIQTMSDIPPKVTESHQRPGTLKRSKWFAWISSCMACCVQVRIILWSRYVTVPCVHRQTHTTPSKHRK